MLSVSRTFTTPIAVPFCGRALDDAPDACPKWYSNGHRLRKAVFVGAWTPAAQPDSISHFGTSGRVARSVVKVVVAPPTRALGAQTSRPCPRSTTSSPSALDIVAPTAVRRPIFHHHRCPCIMPAAVMQRCRVEMRMKAARQRAQTRYRMRGRSRRRACSRRCEGRQTRSWP